VGDGLDETAARSVNEEAERALSEIERLHKTRGGQLRGSWGSLEDAVFVLRGNANDIIAFEQRINESMEVMLGIVEEESRTRNSVLTDLARRLHNFLASAVSLEDQMKRNARTFYRGATIPSELKLQLDAAAESEPHYAVVRALRNGALHHSLPEIRMKFELRAPPGGSINDPDMTQNLTFELDVPYALALIRASGRDGDTMRDVAIDFLTTLDADLPLAELVRLYLEVALPVQDWLRLTEEIADGGIVDEFDEHYNALVDRYNRAIGGR
jgi:hypothetical protein